MTDYSRKLSKKPVFLHWDTIIAIENKSLSDVGIPSIENADKACGNGETVEAVQAVIEVRKIKNPKGNQQTYIDRCMEIEIDDKNLKGAIFITKYNSETRSRDTKRNLSIYIQNSRRCGSTI